jgi:hypothetical protein
MAITIDQLRQHYASLSDEELENVNPGDLTEEAQQVFKAEINQRGISLQQATPVIEQEDTEWEQEDTTAEADDGETFVACSYVDSAGSTAATDAEEAYRVLKAAGIPCRIEVNEVETGRPDGGTQIERQVVVPSALTLHATSVLDREIFNPQLETDWRTHLESLTDDQLRSLNVEEICAGLLDRASRLRKTYLHEIQRRKQEIVGAASSGS